MKILPIALLLTLSAVAQTTPAPDISTWPSITIGVGPTWTRGANNPYALDTTLGIHIGQTRWFSWTTISTPIVRAQVAGAPPTPSTFTTGGAWVAVQSASGAVSLVFIVQAGFSNVMATSTISPAFTGSLAVPIRLGKRPLYVMPFARATNATTSSTSGALATAVMEPGVQLMYGFGGK